LLLSLARKKRNEEKIQRNKDVTKKPKEEKNPLATDSHSQPVTVTRNHRRSAASPRNGAANRRNATYSVFT
jgi:hypothetical protein